MQLPLVLTRFRRRRTLCLWAWLIFWASDLFAGAMYWTNWPEGFLVRLFFTPFLLVEFTMLMVPLTLLAIGLWSWRGWLQECRSLLALTPVLLVTLLISSDALAWRLRPAGRFGAVYHVALPADAREFRAFFSGGGFADTLDAFAFQTNPTATNALLAAHPFKEAMVSDWSAKGGIAAHLFGQVGQDWPDPRTWPKARLYRYNEIDTAGALYYDLITDETMTKVFIIAYGI